MIVVVLLLAGSLARAEAPRVEWALQTKTGQQILVNVLSADGKQVVSGEGGTVVLWDAATGKTLRVFPGKSALVTSLALSEDGKRLLAGYAGGAFLWDTVTGEKLQTLEGKGWVLSVAFSRDGQQVLTGGALANSGHLAILWDAGTGKQLQTFQRHKDDVSSVAFVGDGKQVVTASYDRTAILWDAATGKPLQTFQGHGDAILSVACSADGKHVMTGSLDRTAILWDAVTGKQLRSFPVADGPVTQVALSSDGRQLVTASTESVVRWETATGQKRQTSAPPMKPTAYMCPPFMRNVYNVTISGDRQQAVTGPHLWDTATGKTLQTLRTHQDEGDGAGSPVVTFAVSADAKFQTSPRFGMAPRGDDKKSIPEKKVVVEVKDRTVVLKDVATGKELQTFEENAGPIHNVVLSEDGTKVAFTSGWNYDVFLWDAATGKKLHTFGTPVPRGGTYRPNIGVALSKDGKQIVTSVIYKYSYQFTGITMFLWDTASGKQLMSADKVSVWAFSDDGKYILTGQTTGTATVWEAATGKQVQALAGNKGGVGSVALSEDGKHLWTAAGGIVRLWDVAAGKELCQLYSLGKEWLVITPDGSFDGSEGALKLIAYRKARTLELLNDDQARQHFHRPGLLPLLWKGERSQP